MSEASLDYAGHFGERPGATVESEAILRSIIDSAVDAIIVIDEHGTVLRFNGGAEKSFGYRAHEVVGQNVQTVMPESAQRDHAGHTDRYRDTGEWRVIGICREVEGRRKDGTSFPIDLAVSEHVVDGARLYTGVARDLSELHAATNALRESEQSLRLLVDGVADHALVLLDTNGVILSSNAGLERLTGYGEDELVGRPTAILHQPGDDPRPLFAAAAELGTFETEGLRVRADGSHFAANVFTTALHDDDGRLRGFAKIIRDVTERKAAEEAREQSEADLRQAQRLESVGQLAGGVAHDFNNLLSVILGAATLVETALNSTLIDASIRDDMIADLRQIEQAGERGAALTRQLLIFSRRGVMKPQLVDVNAVIANTAELLRRTLGEHVRLLMNPSAEPLSPTLVDRGQLDQVLVNVVVNARDAMPNGGTLKVETAEVELDEEFLKTDPRLAPGRYVRLAVSDTGSGMTPEVVARAFEPFFTTKPLGQGTGIGLATVHGIVTAAGGTIRVTSEVGVGTCVEVYFRASERGAVADVDAAAAAPGTSRPAGCNRILLVEDDPAVRALARRLLQAEGFTLTTASDGAQAIELAGSIAEPFDLLLTDVVMPGMSGSEVATHMRALQPQLQVLYMSGYTGGALSPHGILDADDFLLEKPFTRASLIRAIQEVFQD